MVMERQAISAEGFLEIVASSEYSDCILELVEGEIVEMPLPTGLHGQITMLIAAKVFNYVSDNGLGLVTAADTGFVLEHNPDGRDTVRGLDIAFIRSTRVSSVLPEKWVTVAPDLAVEVISPSNEAADIHHKIRQLLAAGTTLVWIVYPATRTVEAHSRSGASTLEEGDLLSGCAVLPGFEVPVREIFPHPASD